MKKCIAVLGLILAGSVFVTAEVRAEESSGRDKAGVVSAAGEAVAEAAHTGYTMTKEALRGAEEVAASSFEAVGEITESAAVLTGDVFGALKNNLLRVITHDPQPVLRRERTSDDKRPAPGQGPESNVVPGNRQ